MNNRRITRQNVVRDGNRYCGPLVLAALLGCSTSEAAAKVREATGTDRAIKGMHNDEMVKTLVRAGGFNVEKLEVPKHYIEHRAFGQPAGAVEYVTNTWWRGAGNSIQAWRPPSEIDMSGSAMTPVKLVGPTLAAWLRTREDKAAVYVVNVTGHYVLVAGRKFVDTSTRGEWVNIGDAPHRRTRVENVWRVSR
jgi:hypothetical protein